MSKATLSMTKKVNTITGTYHFSMYRGGGWVIVMVNTMSERSSIARKIILKETDRENRYILTIKILHGYTITIFCCR